MWLGLYFIILGVITIMALGAGFCKDMRFKKTYWPFASVVWIPYAVAIHRGFDLIINN